MQKRSLVIAATIVLALALGTMVMAADRHIGIWKLDVAKTEVTGAPGYAVLPKSCIVKIEDQEKGIRLIYDVVDVEGKTTTREFFAKYNEMDYPVKGDPDVTTVSLRRINASTLGILWKKAGNDTENWRTVVSKDGNSWTITAKRKDLKGENFIITYVFDKQ